MEFGEVPSKGGYLFDRTRGILYIVNETGAYILSLCDGTRTVREIIEEMLDIYDVSREKLMGDVLRFVAELAQRGILDVCKESGSDRS